MATLPVFGRGGVGAENHLPVDLPLNSELLHVADQDLVEAPYIKGEPRAQVALGPQSVAGRDDEREALLLVEGVLEALLELLDLGFLGRDLLEVRGHGGGACI